MRHWSWAERFWAAAGAVSIRVKIMGIVIGPVVMFFVPVTLLVRQGLSMSSRSGGPRSP